MATLAAHPGPDFDVAAAAVLLRREAEGTRVLLERLADGSWVQRTGDGRYALAGHGTAARQRDVQGLEALYRLLRWYLHAAASARAAIVPGAAPVTVGLPRLDAGVEPVWFADAAAAAAWYRQERHVLAAAIEAAFAAGADEMAWKLPVVLDNVRALHDSPDRWIPALNTALLAAVRSGGTFAQATVMEHLAQACRQARHCLEAAGWDRQAGILFDTLADRVGRARTLNSLGLTEACQERWQQALTCYEQARDLMAAVGESGLYTALITLNLGAAVMELGQAQRAEQTLSEAIAALHRSGARSYEAEGLLTRAEVRRRGGRLTDAREDIDRALQLRDAIGPSALDGLVYRGLGRVQRDQGHPAAARESFQLAATQAERHGQADWAAAVRAEADALPAPDS
jgi:tetratricopeptide (TPR) repeat protein